MEPVSLRCNRDLHQRRATDSADINTRLQLSDTSSIPPMHGGFLLLASHSTQRIADIGEILQAIQLKTREIHEPKLYQVGLLGRKWMDKFLADIGI